MVTCDVCVSLRSAFGAAVCSLSEGGVSVCVQSGVCEGGCGLGSERAQIFILQRRCEQLLQRRRQLEV